MKLGTPHLAGALALLVGSIAYNVWAFAQPSKTSAPVHPPAPVDALPSRGDNRNGNAPLDVSRITAPLEVALDRLPEWPRDPFTSAQPKPPVEAVPVAEAAPPPEPDLVVASILYGPERRLAIVNGHIVRVGDTIGSLKVLEIQPRAIVVESATRGRQTIELRMLDTRKGARR